MACPRTLTSCVWCTISSCFIIWGLSLSTIVNDCVLSSLAHGTIQCHCMVIAIARSSKMAADTVLDIVRRRRLLIRDLTHRPYVTRMVLHGVPLRLQHDMNSHMGITSVMQHLLSQELKHCPLIRRIVSHNRRLSLLRDMTDLILGGMFMNTLGGSILPEIHQ